jgi:hypothetical protein
MPPLSTLWGLGLAVLAVLLPGSDGQSYDFSACAPPTRHVLFPPPLCVPQGGKFATLQVPATRPLTDYLRRPVGAATHRHSWRCPAARRAG